MKGLMVGLLACVAFGIYKLMAPKAPLPPPDSAISAREVMSGLSSLFEREDRVCFDLPRLPQGRIVQPSVVPTQVKSGGRRPHLDDLVQAGVLLHARDERSSPNLLEAKWVETYRVAPHYSGQYHHAGERGRLCFARLSVESVLSVQRVAPQSSDHRVRIRFKVRDGADWVRRLPDGARAEAQAWVAGPTRESSLVLCTDVNLRGRPPSAHSGVIGFGMTCAGTYVEDEPARLIVTGPEPVDDQATFIHWTAATYDQHGAPR